jgi:methylenetetrahydrofolate dehydrogenase (NADP+) / methenyltetrahydrofolate cyclohydrolase
MTAASVPQADVINGRAYAADLKTRVHEDIKALEAQGVRPGLATVLVGDEFPAMAYERRVRRLAEDLGCHYVGEHLPASAEEADVVAAVGKLDADPRVHGILVLRPLPRHVAEVAVYRELDPMKDIESVHPMNAGLLALGRPRYIPSTPASIFYMLDRYLREAGHDPAEVYARSKLVVIGRSNNVGKPAVGLALARNATVSSCDVHTSRAGFLADYTARADILIVAAGVAGLVRGEHVQPGVIAIDVGINPVEDPDSGKVHFVGDLDFESVAARASAISPVPGGVGPITDIWLLHNTVSAARLTAFVEPAQRSLDGADIPQWDLFEAPRR